MTEGADTVLEGTEELFVEEEEEEKEEEEEEEEEEDDDDDDDEGLMFLPGRDSSLSRSLLR
jgi:hypothetical protein